MWAGKVLGRPCFDVLPQTRHASTNGRRFGIEPISLHLRKPNRERQEVIGLEMPLLTGHDRMACLIDSGVL